MKHAKIVLISLFTLSLLALTACQGEFLCEVCGRPAFIHQCCPAEPCPVCGETYLCDCAVETIPSQDPCPICGSVQLCDCIKAYPATGEPSPMRAEESSSIWLERPLAYLRLVRTLDLVPIDPSSIDAAADRDGYAQAGVATVKFSELPAQFEIKWDDRIEVEHFTVTRSPLGDHSTRQPIEVTDCKLILEAGYYYEIAFLTPNGHVYCGVMTAAEIDRDAFATPIGDIHVQFTYLGEETQAKITASLFSAYWDALDPGNNKAIVTAASSAYRLAGLCEISATEAQVTLLENAEIASYVISAIPVDENNQKISGTGKGKTFTVVDNTFELLEGSLYYDVYVCFDGSSFTNYGFISHYTP